jgi:hypothetical protein
LLSNTVRRHISHSVSNVQSSVAGEVLVEPSRQSDGSYLVTVEVLGGSYGGKSQLQAIYTDSISGVVGSSIRIGDLVLISFDEKGYSFPRITSVVSAEAARLNLRGRYRPVTTPDQRVESTSLMVAG